MNKKNYSSGFTLTELLVVVAILGIIAAVGITSYNGYVTSAERKSAENLMQQISLGQSEFFSDNGVYYSVTETNCVPTAQTLADIYQNLLGSTSDARALERASESAYQICIAKDETGEQAAWTDYLITASNGTTMITMNSEGEIDTEAVQ